MERFVRMFRAAIGPAGARPAEFPVVGRARTGAATLHENAFIRQIV